MPTRTQTEPATRATPRAPAADQELMPVLRRAPIPLREPQAARSVAAPGPGPSPIPATQGTLALALVWDDPDPLLVPGRNPGRATRNGSPEPAAGSGNGPPDGPVGVLPEPREWAATFVQAAMEVATGHRPAAQLVRWTSPDVHAALARRSALTTRATHRTGGPQAKPRLRTLVLGRPAVRICEAAAVIAEPDRIRAVAFRMEGYQGRWRVTAFEIG